MIFRPRHLKRRHRLPMSIRLPKQLNRRQSKLALMLGHHSHFLVLKLRNSEMQFFKNRIFLRKKIFSKVEFFAKIEIFEKIVFSKIENFQKISKFPFIVWPLFSQQRIHNRWATGHLLLYSRNWFLNYQFYEISYQRFFIFRVFTRSKKNFQNFLW